MRLRMLWALLPGVVLAQSISYGPFVSNISHSSATVTFVTDAAADSAAIEYGRDPAYGSAVPASKGTAGPFLSVASLVGLAPATEYHVRGRVNGSPASRDVVFSTAPEPARHPEAPAPAGGMDVSMPAGEYGDSSVLAVNRDCSNLPSVLEKMAELSGPLNYEVVIPAGAECRGQYTFPARPNHSGWVVVRSSAVGTSAFPTDGVRWTPSWSGSTARFTTNVLPVSLYGPAASFANTSCESTVGTGGYAWATDQGSGAFALYVCEDTAAPYTGPRAITQMSGQDVVAVTAPGHRLSPGDIIRLSLNGYIPSQQVVVVEVHGDTFFVRPASPAPSGARFDLSLTPTFTRNEFWHRLPFSSGDTLPAACNTYDWFSSGGAFYWCTAPNQWRDFRFAPSQAEDHAAIIVPPRAARYRFIGLEVGPEKLAEPWPAGWEVPVSGLQLQGLVRLLVSSHGDQVIWDRCYLHGYSYPQRLGAGIWMSGDNTAIVDSYIDEIAWWRGRGYSAYEGSIGVYHSGGGAALFENNYIAVAGSAYRVPNYGQYSGPVHDVAFSRNWVKVYPKWRKGDPSNTGAIYSNQSPWKIERGERMRVADNFFDGNYSGFSQAPFLAMVPGCAPPAGPVALSSIQDGVLTTSRPGGFLSGDVVLVTGTNSFYDGLWEVAPGDCPERCGAWVLRNAPGGSAAGGSISLGASAAGISDIEIENNTFSRGTDALLLGGSPLCTPGNAAATRRISVDGNFSNDLNLRPFANGGRVDEEGTFREGDFGARAIWDLGGVEDLTVSGNRFAVNRGLMPSLLRSEAISEGLNFSNNFFSSDEGRLIQPVVTGAHGGAIGTAALNISYSRDGQPNWTFANNVICCGSRTSAAVYPSGSSFPDAPPDSDATPSPAQSVSNLAVRTITPTTFFLEFDGSAPVSDFLVEYDIVPSPPFRFATWKKVPRTPTTNTNAITVSGLAPGTRYYWRLKATVAGEVLYSAVQSTQTAAEAPDRFRDPTPPASVAGPVYPGSYATTLTVAGCADIQAKINAAAAATGGGNVKLLIPASLDCAGMWTFPAKAGSGVVVVTSDAPDSALPPAGVRASPNWESAMPKLRVNKYDPYNSTTLRWTKASDGWILRGIEVTEAFPSTLVLPVASVERGLYTVNGHGFASGDVVQVCNAGVLTRNAEVMVVDSDSFRIASHGTTGACSQGSWVIRTPASILALAWMDTRSSNIWFDRCIFRLSYWMPTSTRYGIGLWCTRCGVVNSYLTDIQGWRPVNVRTGKPYTPPGWNPGEAIAIGLSRANESLIENNTVEAPGITLFAEEVDGGAPNAGDLTIRRNLLNWRDELRLGSPTSLGYRVPVRQHLEFKRCERCLIEGNIFRNQWTEGTTGNSANAIVMTPRCSSSTAGRHGSANRIQDITIRNNRFENVNGLVNLLGGETSDRACDVEATQRVLIENNLATSVDGSKLAALPGLNRVWGNLYYFSGALEDVVIRNNTSYKQAGSAPVFLMQLMGRSSGLQVKNNLAFMSGDNHAAGIGAPYAASFVPPVPNANSATRVAGLWFAAPSSDRRTQFANNVMVPLVTDTSSALNYNDPFFLMPAGDCKSAWAGLMNCVTGKEKNGTQRLALPGFRDPANGDFSLTGASPFAGQNIGADTSTIDAAAGKVRAIQVTGVSRTDATITFTRPSDKHCTVEYGTQASYGSGRRLPDGGPLGKNTEYAQAAVTLSGLTPGTQYHYRLLCPAEQPNGVFSTLP